MTASQKAEGKLSFEEALARLESIVRRLEEDELSLEESLALFERGVMLARLCARQLDDVERRIELLVERDGAVALDAAPELEIDDDEEPDSEDDDAGHATA